MVHYAGYTPRFHPSDFETYTRDGVGIDWPLSYHDLKGYYAAIEEELPVAGEAWPWGDPHTYAHRPHPVSGNGEIFLRGARKAGITAKVGPVAIVNGRFGNRPHCIYRGFCLQGCKVNAKASPLITHIPDALAHGAEVRPDSMVTRIEVDARTGRATGCITYGTGSAGSSGPAWWPSRGIRSRRRGCCSTPPRRASRTACATTSTRWPVSDGAGCAADRRPFDNEIRMYKSPPPEVSSEQFYETDPSKPYKRG
ncbi:GMC family oxidoreductase N-terminal domain-containing protein, partial [Micromonospora sp. WMMA1363]|uniref:GMC family oxidoreductase N-terminal domain-containing protein n=1 Tax=Micromonospora sp. WMMA1363 TaxID=3053985 RepID=UPI00259C9D7F